MNTKWNNKIVHLTIMGKDAKDNDTKRNRNANAVWVIDGRRER